MFTYISMLGTTWLTRIPSRTTRGGSWNRTMLTRFCTFTTLMFGSVPGSKYMRSAASPALVAEEVMKRMFWTPLMDCSNGIRTDSTRTLALAPGYEIITITVGGAMLGNWAIGRVLIPSTPRNKRMIEMTIANAGRCRILVNIVREQPRCN